DYKSFITPYWLSRSQTAGKNDMTGHSLNSTIPARPSANSNEVSSSRCLPTPLVRKAPFGTVSIYFFLPRPINRSRSYSIDLADVMLHGIHWFVFAKDRAHRIRDLSERAPIADRVDYW